jgi:hypothetical protein
MSIIRQSTQAELTYTVPTVPIRLYIGTSGSNMMSSHKGERHKVDMRNIRLGW